MAWTRCVSPSRCTVSMPIDSVSVAERTASSGCDSSAAMASSTLRSTSGAASGSLFAEHMLHLDRGWTSWWNGAAAEGGDGDREAGFGGCCEVTDDRAGTLESERHLGTERRAEFVDARLHLDHDDVLRQGIEMARDDERVVERYYPGDGV